MNLKRPVPLWLFLVGLLAVASVSAGVVLLPRLLTPAPDFAIYLNPSSTTVRPQPSLFTSSYFYNANTSGSVLTIKSLNGFTGAVSLATANSSSLAVKLDLSKILLGSDAAMFGLNTSRTMRVAAASVGNYTVTVVATSGSLSHSVVLAVTSQDVNIRASQTSFSLVQGSAVTSTISFTSLNQFKGNLSLSTPLSIVSYGGPPNNGRWFINGTLSASSIVLGQGATSSVDMTVTAGDFVSPGAYGFTFAAYYQQWRWNMLITANVTIAPEPPPTLVSYTINSSTDATLVLRNVAAVAIMITSYRLTDVAGDLARACLTPPGTQTNLICLLASPIDSGATGPVNVFTNPGCGSCANFGNPFTFQTGQSYTVTITTSRQHTITYTIMG